jgi:hypothetical protein
MAHASKKGKGMGDGNVVGHPHVGTTDPNLPDEHDLAETIHGENRLRGKDQGRVRNQRETQPGSLDADNQPPDDPADDR